MSSTVIATLGGATAPFTVGRAGAAAAPARVVAKKGLEFTARTVLVECGPKIIKAVGTQLVKSTALLHSAQKTFSFVFQVRCPYS
jgi:hypothetical protein